MDKVQEISSIANNPLFIKRSFLTTEKGISYPYIRYRLLRPILKLYWKIFRALNYPSPWITPAAATVLKRMLTNEMVGLEYGSGVSTLFLASRLKKLHSIEHYKHWYNKVDKLLRENNLHNVDLELIPPKQVKEIPANPTKEEQKEIKYGHTYFDYQKYSSRINEFPDNYFDFVLIDGRDRVRCLINALPKVKEDGLILLDQSERPHYKEIHETLAIYPKVYTTTGLTDTTIWIKRNDNQS